MSIRSTTAAAQFAVASFFIARLVPQEYAKSSMHTRELVPAHFEHMRVPAYLSTSFDFHVNAFQFGTYYIYGNPEQQPGTRK